MNNAIRTGTKTSIESVFAQVIINNYLPTYAGDADRSDELAARKLRKMGNATARL